MGVFTVFYVSAQSMVIDYRVLNSVHCVDRTTD